MDTALDISVENGGYVLPPQSHIVAEIMTGEGMTQEKEVLLPQHLQLNTSMEENGVKEEEEEEKVEERSPLEQSIDHIASFFGMQRAEKAKQEETKQPVAEEAPSSSVSSPTKKMPASPLVYPPTPPQPIAGIRSAPISVTSNLQDQMPSLPFDDDVLRFLHRGDSMPMKQAASVDNGMPPADIVDPHDGHVWRAKYCVLENGILYFYRNASDGESQEAKVERAQSFELYTSERSAPNASTPEDLSKSPTPRKLLNSSLATKDESAGFIYEKRVFLDHVGAVRSADNMYGECSFELLAVPDEEETGGDGICSAEEMALLSSDKLVLRSRNAEEMREWLFQFHRYLATLMKNLIETAVGSGGFTVPVGDIHHPSFAMAPHEMGLARTTNYKLSPKSMILPGGSHFPVSLTHGHGQSSALRRKRASVKKDTPSSTPSGSPSYAGLLVADYKVSLKPAPSQDDRPQSAEKPAAARGEKEEELPPEFSRPPETCPETERPPPAPRGGKYVPPHLRNKEQSDDQRAPPVKKGRSLADLLSSSERNETASLNLEESASSPVSQYSAGDAAFEMSVEEPQVERSSHHGESPIGPLKKGATSAFKLGGCADPQVVVGSILDRMFVPSSASKVGQVHTEDYGAFGGGNGANGSTIDAGLQWEIGAVSKCGVRESNEDSYLVASNLTKGLESLGDSSATLPSWVESGNHHPGLFCVFDGHGGNHIARFAAEKLPQFLLTESTIETSPDITRAQAEVTEEVLRKAIGRLDDAVCNLCSEDGRDWYSGATAIVALVAHERLVIANLGDCRGLLCRSLEKSDAVSLELHGDDGWTQLDLHPEEESETFTCFFREVNEIHSPSRPDERERIERANGWITTSTDIPFGQLQRMDFCDQDVLEILKRHYLDRYNESESSTSSPQEMIEISRVCGDLAVSRALGDPEYKAAYNTYIEGTPEGMSNEWHNLDHIFIWPDDHSKCFQGDLVSPIPDLQRQRLAEKGVFNEFLLLACDGLWDVMDPDDAIRVLRGLLYEKKWEAKRAVSVVLL